MSFRLDGRVAVVTGGGRRPRRRASASSLAAAGAAVACVEQDEHEARGGRREGAGGRRACARRRGRRLRPRVGRGDGRAGSARARWHRHPRQQRGDLSAPPLDGDHRGGVGLGARDNLKGYFLCARACYDSMVARGHGRIVNFSSITFLIGFPNLLSYVVSKGGVVAFTRALAREVGPDGITVNAIAPGAFPTDAEKIHPNPEAVQPVDPRAAEPEAAWDARRTSATLVVFLASDAASFITGQTIVDRRRLGDALVRALRPGTMTRRELMRRVGRLDQVAGVRLVTLGDGAERGVRVLEFRTGTGFAFDVIVDRAFDIGRCEHAGRALGWQSGGRLRRAVVLRARGPGLLPHLRRRAADDLRARPHPVHGRGHRRAVPLPAEADRGASASTAASPTARRGSSATASAGRATSACSARRARCCRRPSSASSCCCGAAIEARVGESRLRIHDEVENVGHDRTPHMYLYHVQRRLPGGRRGLGAPRSGHRRRAARRPFRGRIPTLRAPSAGLRRAGLRARARRRAGRLGARGDRQPRGSGWGPTRCSGATSFLTTSSGGCSARGRTSSASSRARTAPPAGSTRARAGS